MLKLKVRTLKSLKVITSGQEGDHFRLKSKILKFLRDIM